MSLNALSSSYSESFAPTAAISSNGICDSSNGIFDPIQAYLESESPAAFPMNRLSSIFDPRAVAVIGATDRLGAVGKTIVDNLKASREENGDFAIYPVNPTRKLVCGLPAFPDVSACPTHVDLAVVVTPAKSVKTVVESCGKAKVRAVIIISAGFKEMGAEGLQLENDVVSLARHYDMRLVGPNCLGVMSPHYGVNATFAATNAISGAVAFISQSGAMCTAVLDWSLKERLGFSAFVSIGSMADVDWGDLIDYLGRDSKTHSILIYMETIGNASHFLSAARAVSFHKPIIVIKAGQTEAAAQAAVSHTGSLAGSHDAFLAAMKRAGVMVVDTIGELFDCALVLGKQPRPRGENLLIVTNAGGPGVLATDATTLSGAVVCKLEEKTIKSLNSFLPDAWSHANPVDMLGDASADVFGRTLEVALADKNADGVLVILSPQAVTEATEAAKKVVETYKQLKSSGQLSKPVMCSWMGGTEVMEGFNYLNSNGIPAFSHPDAAARTYGKIWNHTKHLRLMYETPGTKLDITSEASEEQPNKAFQIINIARSQGRFLLSEAESKQVLKAFGIPVAETVICSTLEEAIQAGCQIGYPCVVKLHSETITHKSDVGGVKLNIQSKEEIREAWNSIKANVDNLGTGHCFEGVSVQPMLDVGNGIELIFGSYIDNQFGPLVLFGAGGCMVEIFKDRALGIPPLTPTLAQIQMESTKIYKALTGGHGKRFPGVNLNRLNKAFCQFSQMVCDLSEFVAECDINPFLALPDRSVALDARIVLCKQDQNIPKLVIRPYPKQYVFQHVLNGRQLTVRPVHSNDIGRLIEFQRGLSMRQTTALENSPSLEHVTMQRVVGLSTADYSRVISLAAIDESSNIILGIVRLTRCSADLSRADLKVAICDDMQGSRAVGEVLMNYAIQVSKSENLQSLQSLVFKENRAILALAEKLKFKQEVHPLCANLVQITLELR